MMTDVRRGWWLTGPLARSLAAVAGLAALALLYERISRGYLPNGDDATGVVEAEAVLRGNVLLGGWTLSNISFYTTDLPFYVAGVAIRGVHPSLLHGVPIAIYLVALALAVRLASGGRGGVLGAVVTFVLIGLPSGRLADLAFRGYIRVGTTVALLAAVSALDSTRPLSNRRLALFGLAMTLGLVGDQFTLWVAALPIAAVAVLWIVRAADTEERVEGVRLLAACLASVAVANAAAAAIAAAGGFTLVPLKVKMGELWSDPLGVAGRNARLCAESLLDLFRANPLRPGLGLGAAWEALGLLGLGLVFVSLATALPLLFTRDRAADRSRLVPEILAAVMAANLAAFIFSGFEKTQESARYLIPFTILGSVLAGRHGVMLAGPRARRVGVSLLAVGALALVAVDLQRPDTGVPFSKLVAWLDGRGLRYGYGTYWNASIVSVASAGRVKVRPVVSDRERIFPYRWMSDETWYAGTRANFLVFTTMEQNRPYQIDIESAERAFGPASEIQVIADQPYEHVVLIWDHDVTRFVKGTRRRRGLSGR